MDNITIFRQNFESDFALSYQFSSEHRPTEAWSILFSTYSNSRQSSNTFTASFDGTEYHNCYPIEDSANGVVIEFISHKLQPGRLHFKEDIIVENALLESGSAKSITPIATTYELWDGPSDNSEPPIVSPPIIAAIRGGDGFSPVIVVIKDTPTEYVLRITTKDGSYLTPNLMGEITPEQLAKVVEDVTSALKSIIPSKVSQLENDSQFIDTNDLRLTDARNAKDVYAWAKQAQKPTYDASEVGALPDTTVIPTDNAQLANGAGYATTQSVNDAINQEADARSAEDIRLQEEIDAITSQADVTDVVGTKAELLLYPAINLVEGDVIKVLRDESRNNERTYYRWVSNVWTFVGSEGLSYTKGEVDTLLGGKVDKVVGSRLMTTEEAQKIASSASTTFVNEGLAQKQNTLSVQQLANIEAVPSKVNNNDSRLSDARPANGGNSTTVNNIGMWVGTQAEYDAVNPKNPNTLYHIKE